MKCYLRGVGLLLVLAVATVSAAAQHGTQSANNETNLTLNDLKGRQQSLAQYRGKILVLNFWATWCIPCLEEMHILTELQRRYEAQGVQVIGASADEPSTQKVIPSFLRKRKIDFPVWLGATTADMQRLALGEELPATAIIDRDGQIVGRILGPVEKQDLQQRIEWLLGDRQSPAPMAVVNNIDKLKKGHTGHKHEEESHEHGGVGVEGASTVPS